jgi:hypothetical protein
MDANKEFQNLVLSEVVELRKELRQYKEDADKRIEVIRVEGNERIDKLETNVSHRLDLIEQRQINFEQRQAQHENSTAEGFNTVRNRQTTSEVIIHKAIGDIRKTLPFSLSF